MTSGRRSTMARAPVRGLTAVEIAVAVSIIGSLLAVAVPAFVQALSASRFVEATEGLDRMATAAVAIAARGETMPESAPLTPPTPPPGQKALDPPGLWDGPTWQALDHFRAAPEGVPHAFSFAFDRDGEKRFVGTAHGDLDGDGVTSTFEVRGGVASDGQARVEPGLYVEAEIE